MSPEKFAFGVAIAVFAGGTIGLILQRFLPEHFTTGGPRDMIGAVVGLFTLLSALVLGLLIWTAYGVYSGQNTAVQTLAAKVLQLDLALVDYGSDAGWGPRAAPTRVGRHHRGGAPEGARRDLAELAARLRRQRGPSARPRAIRSP